MKVSAQPPVYFDSAAFIDLLSEKSTSVADLRQLLTELKTEKIRIYTSILTVQEISVHSYRQGAVSRDMAAELDRYARIVAIDRDTALLAAKFEAQVRDAFQNPRTDDEFKTRRKWDCFHLATAVQLGCSVLYTADRNFRNRQNHIHLGALRILSPTPKAALLGFESRQGVLREVPRSHNPTS